MQHCHNCGQQVIEIDKLTATDQGTGGYAETQSSRIDRTNEARQPANALDE